MFQKRHPPVSKLTAVMVGSLRLRKILFSVSGIQYSTISPSMLSNFGCTTCIQVTYATASSSAGINCCSGPHLFVGAIRGNTDIYYPLGAFDTVEVIKTQTTANQRMGCTGISPQANRSAF